MVTSSEVMVRMAGIDQHKALRPAPAQRKRVLNAPRGFCNVTPLASGGGGACAVGFRGIEGAREERRSLGTPWGACTSVTVGSLRPALTTPLQGRDHHAPLPMRTPRPRERSRSLLERGGTRPLPGQPGESLRPRPSLSSSLCWCRKTNRAGPCDGRRAGSGELRLKLRGGGQGKDWAAPGSDLYPLSNHLLRAGHVKGTIPFVPHYSFMR